MSTIDEDGDEEEIETTRDNLPLRVSNLSRAIDDSQQQKIDEILSKHVSLQRSPSFITLRSTLKRQNTLSSTGTRTESCDDLTNLPEAASEEDQENESSNFDQSGLLSRLSSTIDPNAEGTGRCIECVKAIPVFSSDEIEPGDHITFAGALYDHHAIIVQKLHGNTFEIIEATNTFSGVVVSFSKLFGQKAKLTSSEKTFDFSTQKICVIFYRQRKFSKSETVKRAKLFLDQGGDILDKSLPEYKYHLFENNCEHFATYCVTGENFSIQVTKFRLTGRLFLTSGFLGISDEKKRNEKEFESKIICKDCFEINKKLLNVPVRQIFKKVDIEIGDIIRYSYWNLWHEAVVFEVLEERSDRLKCYIAHYAFCGFFSHRTIKKEELWIKFNGSFRKLEYSPPSFQVYDPETVVQRAKSRINEQMFVFFSNDSSHFARWCKLKLVESE